MHLGELELMHDKLPLHACGTTIIKSEPCVVEKASILPSLHEIVMRHPSVRDLPLQR